MTDKEKIAQFQKRLKRSREELNMSQGYLAREIGVSQPHMSYVESGKRGLTLNNYQRIQEIFERERGL